jgi:hypothetical protein
MSAWGLTLFDDLPPNEIQLERGAPVDAPIGTPEPWKGTLPAESDWTDPVVPGMVTEDIVSLSEIPNVHLFQDQSEFATSKEWREEPSSVRFLMQTSVNRNADLYTATLDPTFLFRQGATSRDNLRRQVPRATNTREDPIIIPALATAQAAAKERRRVEAAPTYDHNGMSIPILFGSVPRNINQ